MPSDDGEIIRVPIPQLTEERRKEMAKLVKSRGENGKIAVRNIRRDVVEALREDEKKGESTKDDLTDRYIKEIDELMEKKTAELMEI